MKKNEEDEEHLEWILECLADGKRKVPEFAEQYQSAFNWLKSLRPQKQWKPSEEQLYWLGRLTPNADTEISNEAEIVLSELYKQLKAL